MLFIFPVDIFGVRTYLTSVALTQDILREAVMPVYEFQCQDCGKEFSLTLSLKERDGGGMECPACKSKRLEPLMCGFFAKTSRKS